MMREITIDARNWIGPNDLYDAFFEAVGAPPWHGRNFNALRDSIGVGGINRIEVPYFIRIKNYSSMGEGATSIAGDFVMLIKELRQAGCRVDIAVTDGE
jgi:RNAse (barnase) inhibitor barstar